MRCHGPRSGCARPDVEPLGDLLVEALGVEHERQLVDAARRRPRAITLSTGTLEKSAIFSFRPRAIGRSQRQIRMSGWMPISRISLTECWVGLVLSSPAVAMYGTSVTWTLTAFSRPDLELELADRLEERQRLDVADGAADLDDRDVGARRSRRGCAP